MRSSEYLITLIPEDEKSVISRIDKNLITERPSSICVMHLP